MPRRALLSGGVIRPSPPCCVWLERAGQKTKRKKKLTVGKELPEVVQHSFLGHVVRLVAFGYEGRHWVASCFLNHLSNVSGLERPEHREDLQKQFHAITARSVRV